MRWGGGDGAVKFAPAAREISSDLPSGIKIFLRPHALLHRASAPWLMAQQWQ